MIVSRKSLLAAAAIGSLFLVTHATAQGPGPGGSGAGPGFMMGPGSMMGPGMGRGMMGGPGFGRHGMCNPGGAGFAEWRFEEIEKAISPNDAQRAALKALQEASTKAAETISASCPADAPASSAERLAFMEKRMEAMLQAVKTVRPAFDAFYATLNDDQKKTLDQIGPRRRHGGWGWGRK